MPILKLRNNIGRAVFFKELMQHCFYRSGKHPILIFEVDDSWNSKDVETLLVSAKVWGADENLAKIVIVLSGAVASYNINISYGELRCKMITVGEATDKEAEEFFFQSIKKSPFFKNNKKLGDLVKVYLDNVGRNFLFMAGLDFGQAETAEEMKQIIQKAAITKENEIAMNLLGFFNKIHPDSSFDQVEKEAYCNLANGGTIKVTDLGLLSKVSMNSVLEANFACKPHPLDYNILTGTISISSKMLRKVVKAVLQEM